MSDSTDTIRTNNYDQSAIQVLEGLEPVRKRPGMYIGSTDKRGLHHLVSEIVDNSIDEALAGYCTHIEVTINGDGSVTVSDNGRGIPTGIHEKEGISAVELVLTKLHAGGKFGGKGYTVSGGLHGVGLSVVNALSEWLTVDVYQLGYHFCQHYKRGIPQERLQRLEPSDRTGTTVSFFPDGEIFETLDFEYGILKHRLKELAYLNKGLKITLADHRDVEPHEEVFLYEGGIAQYVDNLNVGKEVLLSETVHFELKEESSEVEIAMQYNDTYNELILAFANNINTEEGGTHLEGFKSALRNLINDYGKKLNLITKDEDKLSGEDVREGLTAVISVKLSDPQFEGQTKTKLGNSKMKTLVAQAVNEKLGDYFENHPADIRNLIQKSLLAKKAREAARNARELTRRKSILENTTLPGKLSDCSERDSSKCEIFIVEGDSAGGTAKQGRDRRFQAILPLRGKILNVEKASAHRVLENEEIRSMITAFGCNIHNDFNIDKLRYGKIICMTDADVDGSHIRILFLTFIYRYMKPLIDQGHVFIAQPPLYKVTKNKQSYYFYNDDELEAWYEANGRKGCEQQRYKGLGEMSMEQLWQTTMNPASRILLQVTMEDAEEAERLFSILMGDAPDLRRQFIEENATLVEDLDI